MEKAASIYINEISKLLLSTSVTDQFGDNQTLERGSQMVNGLINEVRTEKQKVIVIGNGGSAAIASHMQNDLCNAVGVKGIVFNEPPLLTALSNDYGYESAFDRLVNLWANAGDVLIAISSSGKSENILRAVRTALQKECKVITLSGFEPNNPLRQLGRVNFYIAASDYGLVEAAHSVLSHFLTDCSIPDMKEEK